MGLLLQKHEILNFLLRIIMREEFLLQISIACSLAGLALLFFISQTMELEQTSIGKIIPDDIGKNVKVCGEIISKSESKTKHVFLQLRDDSGKIELVIFNNTAEKLNAYELNKQDRICVVGLVDEYQDKLEIVPKEIKKIGE